MGKTLSTCQQEENLNQKKWYKHDVFIERNMKFSTWMKDLSDYIHDTRLLDLNLIRSHQSATYAIDTYFDKVSKCQHASVYYQLYGGVRVIDIRPGIYAPDLTKITCGHGPHRAIRIEEILNSIKNFLNEHEKEFVILEMETAGKFFGVNHELTQELKAEMILTLEKIFGNLLVRKTDDWFDLSKVTMGEIWKNKKQLIIISHSFINNELLSSSAIFDMYTYQFGRYANTKCKIFMQKHVSNYIHQAQEKQSNLYNKFLSVNLQLTAQSIDSIYELNAKLHDDEFLYKWIIGLINEDLRLNIVAVDFCFYNPQFIREIIYSNCYTNFLKSKKLKIQFLTSGNISNYNINLIKKHDFNGIDESKTINDFSYQYQSLDVNIDSIIYDNDIIKLKFHKLDTKDSDRYICVDKKGSIFVQKKCNIYKMKRKLFQIQIVEKEQNIVKLKSCYLSCKELKINKSKINDSRETEKVFNSSSMSQLHNLKDYYLHVDNKNYKNPHLELSEVASLFKLNFTSEKRVCSIELITSDEKIDKKFISKCKKEKSNVILHEKETEMFYLEK